MELETSYRWSEQQLTTAQQEGSRQALDPTQHSELIKDAKRLPELRVRGGWWGCTCDKLPWTTLSPAAGGDIWAVSGDPAEV